ncbi:MAG: hypothetical protein RLZZ622_794, partial [Planctomycetota bacterium]
MHLKHLLFFFTFVTSIAGQLLAEPVTLWDRAAVLPKAAEAPVLDDVAFHVIKPRRPDTDGCNWTLGVGLAWHKG